MVAVTQRIKAVKQPRGGYLSPKIFTDQTFSDGIVLHEESLRPTVFGLTVEYLFRSTLPEISPKEAFNISLKGANYTGYLQHGLSLLSKVKGLDDDSIISAAKLSNYDGSYRSGFMPNYDPADNINPNNEDIENIRIMVQRTQAFFNTFEPVTVAGFTFKENSIDQSGFTQTITAGDGDFLTKNGLWDLKVSKAPPTPIHTLQLLVYYLMGLHSMGDDGRPLYDGNFQNIEHLGIFNPRLNIAYTLNTKDIPADVIRIVEDEVIGYSQSLQPSVIVSDQTAQKTIPGESLEADLTVLRAASIEHATPRRTRRYLDSFRQLFSKKLSTVQPVEKDDDDISRQS